MNSHVDRGEERLKQSYNGKNFAKPKSSESTQARTEVGTCAHANMAGNGRNNANIARAAEMGKADTQVGNSALANMTERV